MNGSEVPLVRAIRGPVTLITVGVLFALNNFTPYRFNQTWPVLLIVFGLLSLMRRGTEPVPAVPVPPAGPQPQTWNYPPRETTGSYRQSTYQGTEPPQSGPVKGGFGTTAPRADEPPPNPNSGESV